MNTNLKLFKDYKLNNSGFSIVGVLIASAVMMLIVTAAMSIMNYVFNGTRRVQQKYDVIEITSAVRSLISDPTTCTNNFVGVDIVSNGNSVTQITNLDGSTIFYAEGSSYENGRITVSSIDIINYQADAAAGLEQYTGVAELQIVFENTGSGPGPLQVMRRLKMRVELRGYSGGAPANAIAFCSGVGSSDSIWTQKADGTIYYLGGNVGVGTTNPAEQFHIAANMMVDGEAYGNAFFYSSDKRLKENIQPIKGLELVEQLNGVSFNWKKSGKADIGVIAQEVERVLPELISQTGPEGMKSVKLANLVAILIESTKELHQSNENLKIQIEELKKKLQ
ncbi:MAG: tail fiber domain-containing protein [Bdellovibrionales bacterium]|nr:tail fiber domain-containing protein [Bdellovibrionales bacterium]